MNYILEDVILSKITVYLINSLYFSFYALDTEDDLVSSTLYMKVALLNLTEISSTWARVIDVMDSEVSLQRTTQYG